MIVPQVDLYIQRGETWTHNIYVKQSDGSPFSLSGYTAKVSMRIVVGGPIQVSLAVGTGITITAGSGLISMALTKIQTIALAFERGKYDLLITSAGGVTTYLIRGDVYVTPRITEE